MPNTKQQKSKWIANHVKRPNPQIRLFTFPFAGGGPSIYRSWPQQISDSIEVISMHYPGRESRFSETPVHSMRELVEGICEAIDELLDLPFSFFGCSMGGVVAFETATEIKRITGKQPEKFIVAAGKAPGYTVKNPLHTMTDERLIETISSYGGIPEGVLKNRELLRLFLPVFRADFSVYETYQYDGEKRLDAPVMAYYGLEDRFVGEENVKLWASFTTRECRQRAFPGGHFFISQNRDLLIQSLQHDLLH
jgi:surfactin synthase thioesterase subunit